MAIAACPPACNPVNSLPLVLCLTLLPCPLPLLQRGDAEVSQKLWRVVRACVELGEANPIEQIHDQVGPLFLLSSYSFLNILISFLFGPWVAGWASGCPASGGRAGWLAGRVLPLECAPPLLVTANSISPLIQPSLPADHPCPCPLAGRGRQL